MENFKNKLKKLFMEYEELISRKNIPEQMGMEYLHAMNILF